MLFAVPQALVSAPNPLAVVCFGLGIAALLFVFRRMIARRRSNPVQLVQMEMQFSKARQRVMQITEREQLHKLRTGQKFYRCGTASIQNMRALARLSQPQAQGAKHHG